MMSFKEAIEKWTEIYNNTNNPILLYDLYNFIKKIKNKYSVLSINDSNGLLYNDIFSIRYNQLDELTNNIHKKYELLIEKEHEKLIKAITINNRIKRGNNYV